MLAGSDAERVSRKRLQTGFGADPRPSRQPGSASRRVLSQYLDEGYAHELLAAGAEGTGYLLKDRVGDIARFVDAVRRVAGGGSAIDPDIVALLVNRQPDDTPLSALSDRELAVLALMAQGHTKASIADQLLVTVPLPRLGALSARVLPPACKQNVVARAQASSNADYGPGSRASI